MAARKGATSVLVSTVICAAVIMGALEWEKAVADQGSYKFQPATQKAL